MQLRRDLTSIIYSEPDESPQGAPERNKRVAARLHDVLKSRPGLWLAYANTDDEPCVEVSVEGVRYAYPRINPALETMDFYVTDEANPTWLENQFMLREPDPADPSWTLVTRDELKSGVARGALIPGLGFDRKLHRLGRGAGFYDRYLEGIQIYKIGVAFAEQLVEELPVEPHDIGVDAVITDRDVLWRVSAALSVEESSRT